MKCPKCNGELESYAYNYYCPKCHKSFTDHQQAEIKRLRRGLREIDRLLDLADHNTGVGYYRNTVKPLLIKLIGGEHEVS